MDGAVAGAVQDLIQDDTAGAVQGVMQAGVPGEMATVTPVEAACASVGGTTPECAFEPRRFGPSPQPLAV